MNGAYGGSYTPRELALGVHKRFNAGQARDAHGKWTSGAGAHGASSGKTYDTTTPEERMALATWEEASGDIRKELGKIAQGGDKPQRVSGNVNSDNARQIVDNARAELSRYGTYLAGDSTSLMHGYLNGAQRLLEKHAGEFSGVKASDMNALMVDSVRKMVYQEVQSNRQQFTDHGVRHITKNIDAQTKILDALEKEGMHTSGRERLMAQFVMANHDMGYTHPMVRPGGMSGIKTSGDHPAYSAKIASEQEAIWDRGRIFTKQEYGRATETIRNHSQSKLEIKDPVTFATQLADNSALFHRDKLPGLFQKAPGSKAYLTDMGKAVKSGDDAAFEVARGKMVTAIGRTEYSPALKRDLTAAVGEINKVTPKLTMGTLAGEMKSIASGGNDGVVKMTVRHNKYDEFLQSNFDMGQRQLHKLLEGYGITDYNQKRYTLGEYNGKSLVVIDVEGV